MPTFTAISLDRLIEPRATVNMAPPRISSDPKFERNGTITSSRQDMVSKVERGVSVPPSVRLERGVSVPSDINLDKGINIPSNVKPERGVGIPPIPKPDRRNGTSSKHVSAVEKTHHWTQISPALYATPESTPLPDAPSSFPPSPYIINHKRRGPRLIKSFSQDDVASTENRVDETHVDKAANSVENGVANVAKDENLKSRELVDPTANGNYISADSENLNGVWDSGSGSNGVAYGSTRRSGVLKSVAFDFQRDSEVEDFVDPLDSMSVMSIGESESNVGFERSLNSSTPVAEFYDAWEELSSESGAQLPMPDVESELREVRLSLLMEIEKRKQAEETINNMRQKWERIREQLSHVGLTLPADPIALVESDQAADHTADMLQQIHLVRFVSNSIGRGIAKAEVEMEMEAQLKLKNSEIARLLDKLHYYEAVNQEMSQRNQEVVETTRRIRQTRKRRQRWIWGSIATVVTLGSAVFAYSYIQNGKGPPSTLKHAPEVVRKSN